MALGPGKYDDLCTLVRERAGVNKKHGGAAVVIIIGGLKGNGFSIQADFETSQHLADTLEHVAAQIRRDITG